LWHQKVVGGQGTGKTSLLRLLLETADISPAATADQQVAVDRFLRGSAKRTQSIQTACVEICESRFDRLLFSIIDTPGLDFVDGHELKLERQVNDIIKYLDAQYADTMSEVRFRGSFFRVFFVFCRAKFSFLFLLLTS
jgi:septin family protein